MYWWQYQVSNTVLLLTNAAFACLSSIEASGATFFELSNHWSFDESSVLENQAFPPKMSMLSRFETQGTTGRERSVEVKFYPCMPEIVVNHTEHWWLKVTINVETAMHWGHARGRIWNHVSFRFSVRSLVLQIGWCHPSWTIMSFLKRPLCRITPWMFLRENIPFIYCFTWSIKLLR